jgi:hypothetical protein
MDEHLIRKAESYAQRTGKSLSQIVADYFAHMENGEANPDDLPPITRSLLGCIAKEGLDESDYLVHVEAKFR